MKRVLLILLSIGAAGLLLLGVFVFGWYLGTEYPTAQATQHSASSFSKEKLFDLVQRWRYENNLQPYTNSNEVCEIAKLRLQETSTNWSHEGFEGKRFCTFDNCEFGENLARGYNNEEQLLTDWLNSASHSANLKADYQYSCIESDGDNVVQIFGNMW